MVGSRTDKVLIYRHAVVTRVTHWINVAAIAILLMSGLQIFNAHPAFYWGAKSTFAQPWAFVGNIGDKGVLNVAGHSFDTTGLLGYSGPAKAREARGFPAWATLPSYRDLSSGRRWHFFFAWIFILNGLVYLSVGLARGHLRRDLLPAPSELTPRHLWHEVVTHAKLKFPKGEEARRYNILQKLSYLAVIVVLLPAMLATGLSMSPGFNAAMPWLPELFGGRQSARTWHFITASLIVGFILVHVAMVLLSGVWNNLRSMITGRYVIDREPGA